MFSLFELAGIVGQVCADHPIPADAYWLGVTYPNQPAGSDPDEVAYAYRCDSPSHDG